MEAYFQHGKQYIKKNFFLLTIFLYEIQHMKLTLEVVIVSLKFSSYKYIFRNLKFTSRNSDFFLFCKILQLWFFSIVILTLHLAILSPPNI